nr:MAG TPA: hypothetical protein [Caudoviricetes sp.]
MVFRSYCMFFFIYIYKVWIIIYTTFIYTCMCY